MATVQRGTVSVVTTELSDRVTPSLVGFTEDQRLMGDHALAQVSLLSSFSPFQVANKDSSFVFFEAIQISTLIRVYVGTFIFIRRTSISLFLCVYSMVMMNFTKRRSEEKHKDSFALGHIACDSLLLVT